MKMVDMGPSERPREKLMEKGPDALSDGELLSIIMRVGRAGENVADMSRRLLAGAGNTLTGLFSMSMERMCEIKGMGPCKTAADSTWAKWYTDAHYYTADRCRCVGRSNFNANAVGGLVFASANYAFSYSYTSLAARLAFRGKILIS